LFITFFLRNFDDTRKFQTQRFLPVCAEPRTRRFCCF